MAHGTLARLLAGEFADPDDGAPLAVPTRRVVIADTLAGKEADLVAELDMGPRLALVSDDNTHRVLGARVLSALRATAEVNHIRLPGRPHADARTADAIRGDAAGCDGLVAVGAGTINDLCKHAAARDGKPYAVFATAPSMNGYTSVNASISVDGHKTSQPAVAASGVYMDLEVLSAAPARMIRSGLGDSLCRPTAQADWLLAHLLLGRAYRAAPFALLAEDEADLFACSDALMGGDLPAMRRLAQTLVLSGFGMTIAGGSHPASEGEHLISHYVEMMAPKDWPEAFHGEQIGVTTLTMARLQDRLLDGPPPRVHASTADEAAVKAHFGQEAGAKCWAEFNAKRLSDDEAEDLNARLADTWDNVRERIDRVRVPAEILEAVLRRAGAPTTPQDLGWSRDFYADAVRHAREIRNRYTFLDLAADSGQLDDVADL